MHNEQQQQQHRTWHVNLISAWQLQSHLGDAVAGAARHPPAGLAADTRQTAVCRDDTPGCEISSRSGQRHSVRHTTSGCTKHYRRSTPRGYPPCRQPPILHSSTQISAGISMGILPHAADLVTLPTFTPPATHQTATSRPRAPAAGLTTQALPAATQPPPDQGGTTQAQTAAGQMLMASATFFPIPENICTKIINLEYVDMAELKPTNWLLHSDETEKASFPFKKRKEPVTDILVWVQCYSAMASIRYPAKIPHLMAYQSTIVKCAKRYQGLAWVAYDMEFRRKAAKTKSLDWGTIDQSAYAEFFTGSSRPLVRCHVCLEDHLTQHCPHNANPFMLPQMLPRKFSSKSAHKCSFRGSQPTRRCSSNSDELTPHRIPLYVASSTQSLEIIVIYKIAHSSMYARCVEVAITVHNVAPPLHQTKNLGAVAGEGHFGNMCNKPGNGPDSLDILLRHNITRSITNHNSRFMILQTTAP